MSFSFDQVIKSCRCVISFFRKLKCHSSSLLLSCHVNFQHNNRLTLKAAGRQTVEKTFLSGREKNRFRNENINHVQFMMCLVGQRVQILQDQNSLQCAEALCCRSAVLHPLSSTQSVLLNVNLRLFSVICTSFFRPCGGFEHVNSSSEGKELLDSSVSVWSLGEICFVFSLFLQYEVNQQSTPQRWTLPL